MLLKKRDRLRLAVFQNLKIFLDQAGNWLVFHIGHNHVHHYESDFRAENWGCVIGCVESWPSNEAANKSGRNAGRKQRCTQILVSALVVFCFPSVNMVFHQSETA